MKFLRNLLIATTAVAAMSATAAFAETTLKATYTDGTVAVTSTSEEISVSKAIEAMGDQVTVVIVPVGTKTVSEGDIYYINQDDNTGMTTILAGMGMKELAETDGTEYEVWIGGQDVSETNPIIKIDFKTVVEPSYYYGDVNLSGGYPDLVDAEEIIKFVGWDMTSVLFDGNELRHTLGNISTDRATDSSVDLLDVEEIVKYLGWDFTSTLFELIPME